MKFYTTLAVAGLLAGASASAGAQSTGAPATHGLTPVVVTAKQQDSDERRHLLNLVNENRRLMADLRETEAKVTQLENRLGEAKADHDRRLAGIAAIDSAAAETRRTRLELEEKLRRLETAGTREQKDGSR